MVNEWHAGEHPKHWHELRGRPYLSSVRACEQQTWSIALWPKAGEGSGEQPKRVPFLCGSWRCRRCASWRGAVDFRRCSSAATSRAWWVYATLTIPHRENNWNAFRAAGSMWNNYLRESLRKAIGRFEYLQTWESTRRGMPHVNILLASDKLRDWVELSGVERVWYVSPATGRGRWCLKPTAFRQWLKGEAQHAGFGEIAWAEVVAPTARESMAAYLVKLARELTGAATKKGDQSPVHAPPRFRRIRASRGLLPRSSSTSDWTGRVVRWRNWEKALPARRPGEKMEAAPLDWDYVRRIVGEPEIFTNELATTWAEEACNMPNGPACRYCGETFRTQHNLDNHLLLSHRDQAEIRWKDPSSSKTKPAGKAAPESPPKSEPAPPASLWDDDDDADDWED